MSEGGVSGPVMNSKSLVEVLAEPRLVAVDDEGNSSLVGMALIDPNLVHLQGFTGAIGTIERSAEHYEDFRNFFGYRWIHTTMETVRAQRIVRRDVAKQLKEAKRAKKMRKGRHRRTSSYAERLAVLESRVKGLIKRASRSVHKPEDLELYSAVAGLVYAVADTAGLGTKKRAREDIVAIALYSSFFEGKPVNIATAEREMVPTLLKECILFFRSLEPEPRYGVLKRHFYGLVTSELKKNNGEYSVSVFAPARKMGNGKSNGHYIPCKLPLIENPAEINEPEKVEKFVQKAFRHYYL